MMNLELEAIKNHLDTEIVGRSIEIHKTVASTNDLAWEAAKNDQPDGWTILTEFQTAGRGRQGRSWFAPRSSSILASILLRPPAITSAPALTIGAAVAVCRACEANAKVKCQLKWPNDVLILEKKIAGILVESRTLSSDLPVYVVGIGININVSRPSLPKELRKNAASLRSLTQKIYDRNPIVTSLLNEFDQNYLLIRERHWSGLEVEYFERLGLADKQVNIRTANDMQQGLLRAFSVDGGLTIETNQGQRINIPAEHVTAIRSGEK